jgi:hypothetical protein
MEFPNIPRTRIVMLLDKDLDQKVNGRRFAVALNSDFLNSKGEELIMANVVAIFSISISTATTQQQQPSHCSRCLLSDVHERMAC